MARAMICVCIAAGIATAQSKAKKPAAEPKAFYEDCGDDTPCLFDNPEPLPDNVLDAIRATKEAKSMHDKLKKLNRDEFAQLFKATKIHLRGPEEIDYVVLSEFPMGGADAPWFWIVRYDRNHPKVIFFTFANGFEIMKSEDNGYPIIRSLAFAGGVTYTNIYQYNGEQCILVRKYQKETTP
jgi:hypothetical protein